MIGTIPNGPGKQAAVSRVGVVGLGRMGLPIARHLSRAGFRVFGCDPSENARRAAEDFAVIVDAPGDLGARTDLVLLIVPGDDDLRAVCTGDSGLLPRGERGLTVAVCSSVHPTNVIALEEIAAARGIDLLDLPMTNGVRAAEAGTLTLLAGGEAEVLVRVRPALETFSRSIHYVGPLGAGQVAKMVNNLLLWSGMTACAEALDFGKALGVPPERLRRALADCSADSWVLRELARIQPTWPAKDLAQALKVAEEIGAELPLTATVAREVARYDRAALDRILELDI